MTSSSWRFVVTVIVMVSMVTSTTGFMATQIPMDRNHCILHSVNGDVMDESVGATEEVTENAKENTRRDELKRQMLQLAASYDRGFGASPRARAKVDQVITELESLNQEVNASRFISGPGEVPNDLTGSTELSPLAGNWRLLWTTASDVLSLGASPFLTVGAIYQLFDPPLVTNVIDLLPRVQNLLPPSLVANSQLRAEVQTRASPRKDKPMRIGLDFEKVTLKPVELLGQDVESILPPFGFDLPKLFEVPDDVGYFDVTFLDAELVIIRQNAPGGCFVLTQVEDSDP